MRKMRIVVDIGHPGHVHFFKNFIWEMEKKGHKILITARDKEVALKLLDNYGFKYINLGKGGGTLIKKIINLPLMDLKMYKAVRGFKPDLFVGISSYRASHVSKLTGSKCIIFDDTEHSAIEHLLYRRFAHVIATPSCFKKDFGKKQKRYDGYHELAYLHPKYFKPNPAVLKQLGVKKGEKYFILRFVAWAAGHDVGNKGLSLKVKKELIHLLKHHGKVFISSEGTLPEEFEAYRIHLSPDKIHDCLYYATMCIGEGATITTESVLLGTPAIYISTLVGTMGNFIQLEKKYDLCYSFTDADKAMKKIKELLHKKSLKKEWHEKRQRLLKDKIDVTKLIIDLSEDRT